MVKNQCFPFPTHTDLVQEAWLAREAALSGQVPGTTTQVQHGRLFIKRFQGHSTEKDAPKSTDWDV